MQISSASTSPEARRTMHQAPRASRPAARRASGALAGDQLESGLVFGDSGVDQGAPRAAAGPAAPRIRQSQRVELAASAAAAARLQGAGAGSARSGLPGVGRQAPARFTGFDLAEQGGEAAAERAPLGGLAHEWRSNSGWRQAGSGAAQDLGGELDIGLRAGAAMVVDQHRLAAARAPRSPHVARDHRHRRQLGPEMLAHVEGDEVACRLLPAGRCMVSTTALQFDPRVPEIPAMTRSIDAHQLAQAFELHRIPALHRHQRRIGGDQRSMMVSRFSEGGQSIEHLVPSGHLGADHRLSRSSRRSRVSSSKFGAAQILGKPERVEEPGDFGRDDRRAEFGLAENKLHSWSPGRALRSMPSPVLAIALPDRDR